MHFSELPVLGVGLAADVSGIRPNYRRFLESADTIDYLSFGAHYVQRDRIRHYIADLIEEQFPVVFHPINFNVAVRDTEADQLINGIAGIAAYTRAVWTGQDVALWGFNNQYLGSFLVPPVFDEESVAEAVHKVRAISSRMPCPFLIENPPVNFSLERMHMLDYMARVSLEADCGMVLDIGHLIGYQQATGRQPEDMPLHRFPFDRVVEVHLAGLQISKVGVDTNFIDQHSMPVHELCWEFLIQNAHRMTCLKGLTLEQEFCEDELVLDHLRRARSVVKDLGLMQNAN